MIIGARWCGLSSFLIIVNLLESPRFTEQLLVVQNELLLSAALLSWF